MKYKINYIGIIASICIAFTLINIVLATCVLFYSDSESSDSTNDQQIEEIENLDKEIKEDEKIIEENKRVTVYCENIKLTSTDYKIIDDYGDSTGIKKVGFKVVVENKNDVPAIISLRVVLYSKDDFELDWFDIGIETISPNSRTTISDWFMITNSVLEKSSQYKIKVKILG